MADSKNFEFTSEILVDLRETHPRVSNHGVVDEADVQALTLSTQGQGSKTSTSISKKDTTTSTTELSALFKKFGGVEPEKVLAAMKEWQIAALDEEHMVDPARMWRIKSAVLDRLETSQQRRSCCDN